MNRWSLLVMVGLAAACGGAEQSSLLEDSGTSPGDDASVKPDTGPSTDGGVKADATDDGPTVVDVVTIDVPVGPPDSVIHCGTTTCSAKSQVCCATYGSPVTYACVGSLGDCQGQDQAPIACSSGENCASQGNAGFICCATAGGPPNPNGNCSQITTVSHVQCQQACDSQQGEFEIGCDPQTQNCSDNTQTCIASKCTLPGYGICQ